MLYTLEVFVYNKCVCASCLLVPLVELLLNTCTTMVCFLVLGASRISASDHMYCNMFMSSIPENLNSGMLAGVDTSLCLWGVVSYYLYSGWGLHPRAFLNSGIRDSLLEQPSFWQHAANVLTCRANGRSTVLGGP